MQRAAGAGDPKAREPVWLVRAVLILVLVGLSAYWARQAWLAWGW